MCRPEWQSLPIRFDVVAFDGIDTTTPQISWIRNAFEAA
jgi:Holliday junction resolvase-like predicted endonuclease